MTVERDTVSLGSFEFERGGTIPDLELAYETYGEFTGDNAILACHALTMSQRVADSKTDDAPPVHEDAEQATPWWDDLVGPGKTIDTDEYSVVCANVPGSCYGSTGPASTNPETGDPYGSDFPIATIGDWTRAQRRLLDHLGIDHLHAVVGGSTGGMNVLDWAKRYPADVDRVIPIAATARLDAQCLAFDTVARHAITADPNWRGGDYYDHDHPDRGLMLARQIGHVRYLSKDSMAEKFGREVAERDTECPFPADSAADAVPYRSVESYLDYRGEQFVERFDANSYLSIVRAVDEYDLADGYDSDADALADFDGEALLLSFTGDWYFPVEDSRELESAFEAAGVPVTHRVLDSEYGHDAFLAQQERVGPPIRDFLADGIAGVTVRGVA